MSWANLDSALAQMQSAGLVVDRVLLGRIVRCKVDGDREKRGWYHLGEFRTDAGDVLLVGAFGVWRGNENNAQKIELREDMIKLGAEQRERMRAQLDAQQRQAEAEQQARNERAQVRGLREWRAGLREGMSPYLARKGVEPEGCRWRRDGAILLPLLRYDLPREQSLMGLQIISPDGAKLFTPGLAKRGASLRLGLVDCGQPVMVCEGYATGLTLRMATDRRVPVFVALDVGNLEHVVAVVQQVHPGCPVLVCADDDWQTDGNPGVTEARRLAKRMTGVHAVYPIFPRGERGRKETDFNDLHARCGLQAVAEQLRAPLRFLSGVRRAA